MTQHYFHLNLRLTLIIHCVFIMFPCVSFVGPYTNQRNLKNMPLAVKLIYYDLGCTLEFTYVYDRNNL